MPLSPPSPSHMKAYTISRHRIHRVVRRLDLAGTTDEAAGNTGSATLTPDSLSPILVLLPHVAVLLSSFFYALMLFFISFCIFPMWTFRGPNPGHSMDERRDVDTVLLRRQTLHMTPKYISVRCLQTREECTPLVSRISVHEIGRSLVLFLTPACLAQASTK